MERVTLDCRNLPCPKPVLKTKDALDEGAQQITVIVDNEASRNNVIRFARNRKCTVEIVEHPDGAFYLGLTASGETSPNEDLMEHYSCELPVQGKVIYVIPADTMGRGDDELGWALMQTFVQTIADVSPLPDAILLYNSGVKLVTRESGALEALQALQNRKVEILVCGTCLDFYNLKAAIQVGSISNMYDIMDAMAQAGKVICPH